MRFAQNFFFNVIVVNLRKLFFEIIDLRFQFIDLFFVFVLCVCPFFGLIEGNLTDWLVLQFQGLNHPLFCKKLLSYRLSFKTLWIVVFIKIFDTLAVQNSGIFCDFLFICILITFCIILNYTGVAFKPFILHFTIVFFTRISLELHIEFFLWAYL
jgi:hypothetical protein